MTTSSAGAIDAKLQAVIDAKLKPAWQQRTAKQWRQEFGWPPPDLQALASWAAAEVKR